jgi:hypothetical protein
VKNSVDLTEPIGLKLKLTPSPKLTALLAMIYQMYDDMKIENDGESEPEEPEFVNEKEGKNPKDAAKDLGDKYQANFKIVENPEEEEKAEKAELDEKKKTQDEVPDWEMELPSEIKNLGT